MFFFVCPPETSSLLNGTSDKKMDYIIKFGRVQGCFSG